VTRKAAGKRVTKRKTQRKAPVGTITGPCMDKRWQTPPELLEPVRVYFGGRIPFDAATTEANPTGAKKFATERDNSLAIKWPKQVYINPPYGDDLHAFMGKTAWEAQLGNTIITLLPCSRWEQRYWQMGLIHANAVCWIRKRVSFIRPATGDRVDGNPYANMFLGFNVDLAKFAASFGVVGACQTLSLLCPTPPEDE